MAYRPLRQRRINRLEKYGFTHTEAINLTRLKTIYPSGEVRYSSIILNRPYVREMMKDRFREYRQAQRTGVSKAEWVRRIQQKYVENGWLTENGTPDYWAMFRFYYRQAVRLGKYKPPPEKRPPYDPDKPHKKKTTEGTIDREHIKKQAAKYRSKAKTERAMTGDRLSWISQLKQRMNEAKTPQMKAQFRQQIINLGGTP